VQFTASSEGGGAAIQELVTGGVLLCRQSAVNPSSREMSGHRVAEEELTTVPKSVTSERRGFVTRLLALATTLVSPVPVADPKVLLEGAN